MKLFLLLSMIVFLNFSMPSANAYSETKADPVATVEKANLEIWKPLDHDNTVYFEAKANPGFLRFEGGGAKVIGEIIVSGGKASGTLKIKMSELKTKSMVPGDSLRDKHMADFFEIEKFPEIILALDPVLPRAVPFAWTGQLTIKGVEKPIKGDAVINTIRDHLQRVTSTFKVDLNDYPTVGKISHAGVTVDNVIILKIDFIASNQ